MQGLYHMHPDAHESTEPKKSCTITICAVSHLFAIVTELGKNTACQFCAACSSPEMRTCPHKHVVLMIEL
jgi:hypothetical protein